MICELVDPFAMFGNIDGTVYLSCIPNTSHSTIGYFRCSFNGLSAYRIIECLGYSSSIPAGMNHIWNSEIIATWAQLC